MTSPRITVLGSINMDLVVRCQHLPRPGETIIAEDFREIPGGKGANQAVAAARLGASVSMIGRVGDDAFAGRLLETLRNEQIDTEAVLQTSDSASGVAIVAVEDSGENAILVVSGANARVSAADVAQHAERIRNSDVLLLQLEIPVETVLAAIRVARDAGVRVILDPAPVPGSFPEPLLHVDALTPNRSEAAAILGRGVDSADDARAAAHELVQRGARQAVITLGAEGAVLSDGHSEQWVPPFPVKTVDTTAAGDAFAAALAVRWAETHSLTDAVRFASAAGALAASRAGAQPGMPRRPDVDDLVDS